MTELRWVLSLDRADDCEAIKEILSKKILPQGHESLDWNSCKDWKAFLNVYLYGAISSFAEYMGDPILGDMEDTVHSCCDAQINKYTLDYHSSPPKRHNAGCMIPAFKDDRMLKKIFYCDHVFPEARTPISANGSLIMPRKCVIGELKIKSGKKRQLSTVKDQESQKHIRDQKWVFKAALGAKLANSLVWWEVRTDARDHAKSVFVTVFFSSRRKKKEWETFTFELQQYKEGIIALNEQGENDSEEEDNGKSEDDCDDHADNMDGAGGSMETDQDQDLATESEEAEANGELIIVSSDEEGPSTSHPKRCKHSHSEVNLVGQE